MKSPLSKTKSKQSWVRRTSAHLFGWLARAFTSLLFLTCRQHVYGDAIVDRYRINNPGKGLLYASWHRGILYFIHYYRGRHFVVMASASKDGELAAQMCARHGWKVVRGSSSHRGSEALREMIHLYHQGYHGGLVVDAPVGPAHASKIGIIIAAKRTGLPIVPVMWSADRAWRIKSWDRTIIPKPFAKIVHVYNSDLLSVPREATRADCQKYQKRLDHILNRLMYQVDHCFTYAEDMDPRQIAVSDEQLGAYLKRFETH